MLIDSMKLAYKTFQYCRHLYPDSGAMLAVLIETLDEVQESGMLTVDVPESRLKFLSYDFVRDISCGPDSERGSLDTLPESSRRLLSLCCSAADELSDLWVAGARGAVRALGYALHIVPSLVASGNALHPELFNFNFRVAAFHWLELSTDMRVALTNAAGIEQGEADKLARTDGFGLDIFHKRRKKTNSDCGSAA